MKLNTRKIKVELVRIDRTVNWLARQLEIPRQKVAYWLDTESPRGAEDIARVLHFDPKDLIIFE